MRPIQFTKLAILSTITLLTSSTAFVSLAQDDKSSNVTAHIEKANGLESVEFDTLTGVVRVDLPDDMSESDTITGSVITEPKGDTKEEIAQNEDSLTGYVVEIQKTQEVQEPEECKPKEEEPKSSPKHESKPIAKTPEAKPIISHEPPSVYTVPNRRNSCSFKVPPKCGSVKVVIKDHNGGLICQQNVRCNPKPPLSPPKCSIPPTGTCGKSLRVPGPFDGRTATAKVAINGKSCAPVAISPRQYIASVPTNTPGKCSIAVTNRGQVTRGTITLAPAKYVAPKPMAASVPPPQAKPVAPKTYYFRLTGPFVTEEHNPASPADRSVSLTRNKHDEPPYIRATWVGQSVYDRNGQTSTATFTYTPPPDVIRLGDRFAISANVTGTKIYAPLVSLTCASPWLKQHSAPFTFGIESPFIASGSKEYELIDLKKMTDDYTRQHPEMAGKYPLDNNFELWFHLTGPRGYNTFDIKYIYVMSNE